MNDFKQKTVGFVNYKPVTLIGKSPRGVVFTQTEDGVRSFQAVNDLHKVKPAHYFHRDTRGNDFVLTVCQCNQPQAIH